MQQVLTAQGKFLSAGWLANRISRQRRRLPEFLIFCVISALYLGGAIMPLDHMLTNFRFSATPRAATGDLIFVRIDPNSLQELNVWPWPRSYHADVVNRLIGANASEIAVDVDFSAYSTAEQDEQLARAFEQAQGRVILPVFRQQPGRGAALTEFIETAPLPMFRNHVQVGGVTLIPSSDSLVRSFPSQQEWQDKAVATIPTLLAGPVALNIGHFQIDYGIDPDTIPNYSFVDILRGNFPQDAFAGKKVLVGAAAAELGDQHSVPRYQALYGPEIQILAYESMVQNRALRQSSPEAVLIAMAILAYMLGRRFTAWPALFSTKAGLGIIFGIEGLALGLQAFFPVVVTTGPLLLVIGLCFTNGTLRKAERQARILFRQRMAMGYRRALMHRVMEDSFDGVAITDSLGRIEAFNDAASRILEISPTAVRGQMLVDIMPEVALEIDRQLEADYANKQDYIGPFEKTVRRKDGEPVVLEFVVGRSLMKRSKDRRETRTSDRYIYSVTFRDVTLRAQALAAQRQAVTEAQAASRTKSEFLAMMGHELRTPLNAIIGFSDLIASEAFGPLNPPQYKEYIGDIQASGHRLLDVINDILDVSKIDTGEFVLDEEEIDLEGLFAQCLQITSPLPGYSEREVKVSVPADMPALYGDERLVKQSVANLLSNAVKFSGPGDQITLSSFVGDGGSLIIEVADTGLGIPSDKIDEITAPFYQIDSTLAREQEGTGLGLALVAAYTTAHDGTVEVKSKPDVGTTIRLVYPVGRSLPHRKKHAATGEDN